MIEDIRNETLEAGLAGLDEATLFQWVGTESGRDDRRAWLAVQRGVRARGEPYSYLEIGSYLGGSLQPYVIDPLCTRVYSIDNRSTAMPDDREPGFVVRYSENTTALMLENLARIPGADRQKIECFDSDASEVDPFRIDDPPAVCFIDGEHTFGAVRSDFDFCRRVASPNAAILFHDTDIVHPAIRRIVHDLDQEGAPFVPLYLGDKTFLIALGECPVLADPFAREVGEPGRRALLRMRLGRAREHLPKFAQSALTPIARLALGRRIR